jgi:hypothetical protein
MRVLPGILIFVCCVSTTALAETQQLRHGIVKHDAIRAFQRYGVKKLYLGPDLCVSASRASEVGRFKNAEKITLGAGTIRILFAGDRVASIHVAKSFPKFAVALWGLKTRDEVLAALELLLREKTEFTFKSCPASMPWIGLKQVTERDRALLDRHDRWSATYQNFWGVWNVVVGFGEGRVTQIEHEWLPFPE